MSSQSLDDTLEQIKALTDPVANEALRQDIIDYVHQLYETLTLQEHEAFGFGIEDVQKRHLRMQIEKTCNEDFVRAYEDEVITVDTAEDYGFEVLPKEQCIPVLDHLLAKSDMSIGVNWDDLEMAIEYVVFS